MEDAPTGMRALTSEAAVSSLRTRSPSRPLEPVTLPAGNLERARADLSALLAARVSNRAEAWLR